MKFPKASASTIPYQLRPHKAIERNLFIAILRKLDNVSGIDLNKYRYVGFGAPFLEDFKLMHLELGIGDMHCIEYDKHAHSRQVFNNPYYFLQPFNCSSTQYISSEDFVQDKNQVIWLDFASPKQLRQQLMDVELLGTKVGKLDILKFTFNSNIKSFVDTHNIKKCFPIDGNKVLKFLQTDPTYQNYLPETTTANHIIENFSSVIRAMATRAITRGLGAGNASENFNHIASFTYADGQLMTTMTGIIEQKDDFKKITKQSGLDRWEFHEPETDKEFLNGNEISVPAMTVSERIEIDKQIPAKNIKDLISDLKFYYGNDEDEHIKLIEGYCRYYKFFPYYSRVTY
jgi:hypothetical protein